jgi:CheY-like chemotaxis protein
MTTPLNILVVEDSQDDADLMLHELSRAGFNPTWKRVKEEAEFLAEIRKQPDIILSDYALPSFTGLRAVKLLRESGLKIPFILVSGTVGEDIAVEAMKYGATDYLLKDRVARLGSAVRRALDEQQLCRQRQRAEDELRESEEKFRQLAENINEIFWMIAPSSRQMLYISPAYEKIWGRSCDSLYHLSHPPPGRHTALDSRPGLSRAQSRGLNLPDCRHRRRHHRAVQDGGQIHRSAENGSRWSVGRRRGP